jgi:hypothetical protein
MPITLIDRKFTDIFGNDLNYYEANAGDQIDVVLNVRESILLTANQSNFCQFDMTNNTIQWVNGDFMEEGFRTGDDLVCVIHASNGSPILIWNASVVAVNGNMIELDDIQAQPNIGNDEDLVIHVSSRKREGVLIEINHVQNNTSGSEFSLIDGEVTAFNFDLTGAGPNYAGVQVAKQSGQFQTVASMKLTSTGPKNRYYEIIIRTVQSGIYDSTQFDYSNCLKLYIRSKWQSLIGESFSNLIHTFSEDANTGWFDQPFNTSVLDATLVSGISELAYDAPTTGSFVIDSASPYNAIGSSYIPDDEAYYKNKFVNQSELGMTIDSTLYALNIPNGSPTNPDGANYSIEINSITTVGTQKTVNFTFDPNPAFTTFFQDREDGDRLFRVWFKAGNVNVLVFNDQLISNPPVGGPLDFENKRYFDHSENITESTGDQIGYSANIEDDLAFFGNFLVDLNANISSFNAKIEAYNSVSGESFPLTTANFDFTGIPVVGGKVILNETLPIQTQLPTTSEKRSAILKLDPSIDTVSQYGISIYFPFLYRWEYWLQQLNANADFYPNEQTKNWLPYDTTGNWTIRLECTLINEGLSYIFTDSLEIKDYDSNIEIDQTIDLFLESSGQLVYAIIDNDLMRIKATHELTTGNWDQENVWGQITIEPKEGSPRWTCSTVIPFDNNSLNPLQPVSGSVMAKTFPALNIVQFECYFDTTKMDTTNGVSITTKVKGCKN